VLSCEYRKEAFKVTIENELTEKHEVIVEDLEYARVGDMPLLARLYRPRGVTGFASVIDVHGGAWVANDRLQNAAIDQRSPRPALRCRRWIFVWRQRRPIRLRSPTSISAYAG
jgi:hypothetical protein